MDHTLDIYEEYPELKELKTRRSTAKRKRRRRRGMSNNTKLLILILIIAGVFILLSALLPRLGGQTSIVYGKDGKPHLISPDKKEQYLAKGYYESPAELVPVTMYAVDGSAVKVLKGDMDKLEQKGYTADKSAVFTTLYADDGSTLYVPNNMADTYISQGWHSKLSDIITQLYKPDGSKLSVPKNEAAAYIEQGWSDRLLKVAKKMQSPSGEEKFVFNDDVNGYLDKGWTIIKRVVDPDQPMVALTFDDGPGKYTDRLLKCLEKNNSAATFFVLGSLAEKYPDTVKQAVKIGCEIGNHTWDHVNLTSISAQEGADTVEKTSDAVKKLTGKGTALYRPCFGAYNDTTLKTAGLPAIMWSIDTLDWKTRNADSTYKKIMDNVEDGAIILMHDIHSPTVDAAERAIPDLVEAGYQLVTVSELLEYRAGGAEAGQVYFECK